MKISPIINKIIFYINRFNKTDEKDIKMIIKNTTILLTPNIKKMIIFPFNEIEIAFEIEPTRQILYNTTFKSKKGYFTLGNLLSFVIKYYSKPHSSYELKMIKKFNEYNLVNVLNGRKIGYPRSYYLYSNIFKGFEKNKNIGDKYNPITKQNRFIILFG